MSYFSGLSPHPADPLLGLMAEFRDDPRTDKIDLGVGVYRDETGNTPVFAAVREAERRIAEDQITKVYEGPQGNPVFTEAIGRFVFPKGQDAVTAFATPGGCGALALAMALVARVTPNATIWMSDPTWPNHLHVADIAGLSVKRYHYAGPADPHPDMDKMIADLSAAKAGDIVLLQGPCHNPTGIDLTTDQWCDIGALCAEKGMIPLIDIAYHGFAVSIDDDLKGVHAFLESLETALVCYSCSKNFGLYRERAGVLLVKASNADEKEVARSHLADIGRALWSMPPAHGPAIVGTILSDEALTQQWLDELNSMRTRITGFRASLAAALQPRSNSYDPRILTQQNGMFSQLPLADGGAVALKAAGVYVPGSGRINIAGLTSSLIEDAAKKLSGYL